MTFPINLLIIILFMAGVVFLEIFLARRTSKWPGLLLPIISFLYSLVGVFGLVGYIGGNASDLVVHALLVFLQMNIPTAILLVIYFYYREKLHKNKELKKMQIQDLDS